MEELAGSGSEARMPAASASGVNMHVAVALDNLFMNHERAEDGAEGGDWDPQGLVTVQEDTDIADANATGAERNVDVEVERMEDVRSYNSRGIDVPIARVGEECRNARLLCASHGRH